MKYKLLLIVLLFVSIFSQAQINFRLAENISVLQENTELKMPWAGGLNSPQFSMADFNNDGLMDIFTLERDWNARVKVFVASKIDNNIVYKFEPYYSTKFPELHNWALLRDYNNDGLADIFTSVPAGIAVYKNVGLPGRMKWQLQSKLLRAGSSQLYVSPPDIPSITDIDGDGDLDILSFGILGQFVKYYRNTSIEEYNDAEHLDFVLDSECWGYFSESSQNNTLELNVSCDDKKSGGRHAGSAILALDLNNSGVMDLLIGDISYPNMAMLNNRGSTIDAKMDEVKYDFPSNDIPVNLEVFPSAYNMDVDQDGIDDLIVSPNNPNTSENYNNILYYRNIGVETANFKLQTNSFLQNEMIDVGEGAAPAFVDVNQDGLQDIVIGNFGYYKAANQYDSKLMLLLNTGTENSPEFSISNNDFSSLSQYNLNGIYPAFADMDADGDLDMISGDEEGQLHYFVNTANEGEMANYVLSNPFYMQIDVGETAIPQLVDVNRDGLIDLLIGEKSGTINFFQNKGTTTEAFFSNIADNDFFGGIDVEPECCSGYASSWLTDDSIGEFILFVASEKGRLYTYNNIEDNIDGSFNLTDSLELNALQPIVRGGDLNNSGKINLLIGDYAGGISIYEQGVSEWNAVKENVSNDKLIVFPLPASDEIYFYLDNEIIPQSAEMSMFNLSSTLVYNKHYQDVSKKCKLDISDVKPGVYILSLRIDSGIFYKRIVVL